ncbi:hypothetical protein N9B95_03700 [Candidatus Pelagibacter sp.]|nr:hypothetical protein [Candidatus Pelagibacter sp.]
MIIICIGGAWILGFILPDENKSRLKSAKDSVKTDFPGIFKLLILALCLLPIIWLLGG